MGSRKKLFLAGPDDLIKSAPTHTSDKRPTYLHVRTFMMGQEINTKNFQYRRQPALHLPSTLYGPAWRHRIFAALNLDEPVHQQATKTEYIYCVKLPNFVCTPNQGTQVPELTAVQPLRRQTVQQRYRPYSLYPRHRITSRLWALQAAGRQQEWIQHEVVKIGKSENPARRFHEILGVFQNLDIQVPLLQVIKANDDPQTTLQKAKLVDSVVFLVKVRDIGTAEEDIRKALGISLGQGFIDYFLSRLDEEHKKPFKDDAGMTEWVLMDSGLVADLQWNFHYSQLCQSHLNIHMGAFLPRGDEATRQLRARHLNYYIRRNMSKKLPPEFLISFQPTNFSYHFKNRT